MVSLPFNKTTEFDALEAKTVSNILFPERLKICLNSFKCGVNTLEPFRSLSNFKNSFLFFTIKENAEASITKLHSVFNKFSK